VSASSGGPRSPFKGLSAFDDSELDALFFFGRELERELIVANVVAKRITVLYGDSGVGKSSLLRAGVMRRLRDLEPDGVVVLFDTWSEDVSSALDEVRRAQSASLVLDQFEEYFLYHGDSEGEGTLASELPELMHENPRVNVLISLREDSLARLDAFKAGLPAVFANQLRLEHLDRKAAREAIVGPVARWNELTGESVEVEPGLVDAVIDEVAGVGGRGSRIEAPYLQLVLERLWGEERAGGSAALRLSTLRSLGGAETIVREHLERALDVLDPGEKDVAASMFDHLVTPSGTKVAHRVGDLAEYASVPQETLLPVLATLNRERILRTVDGAGDGRDRYEIFHDVLAEPIRAWRLQRRLERERRAANRRQRKLFVFAVAAAVALAIVTAVALFALVQRSHARAQARHAHAGELAATALADLSRDPVRSLQLALAAVRVERSPRVADVLRSALVDSHVRLVIPARGAVTVAAFSPNSRLALVGASDGRASVYDVETSRRLLALRVPGAVVAGSFSPDSHEVLVAGGGRVLVRGLDGNAIRHVLKHRGVRTAAFSVNGAEIASGGADHDIRVWRVQDGHLSRTIPLAGVVRQVALTGTRVAAAWSGARKAAHVALLDAAGGDLIADLRGATLEFSPDGSLLATGDPDSFARVYRAGDGTRLLLLAHGGPVTSVDFRQDGKQLVTASADGGVRQFDVATGTRSLMPTGSQTVESARYSRDGRYIVSGGTDRAARIWYALNGRELVTLNGHHDTVSDAAFSRDDHYVITASNDGTARIWDTGLEDQLSVLGRAHGRYVRAGFMKGGTLVFAAARDGRARVWRLRDRALVLSTKKGTPPLADATAAGSLLATVDDRGTVAVWNVSLRKRLLRMRVPRPGRLVALSGDGRTLLAAGGRVLKVVASSSGRPIATLELPGRVTDARFGAGGIFAAVTATGRVLVWKRRGTLLRTFDGGRSPLRAVALSPDGTLVAAASRDRRARIWSIVSGKIQHRLRARTPLTDVEFSHDGRLLATAAIGGDVRIWTVSDGRVIHILTGFTGRVARVVFSPDDQWLIAAGPTSGRLWQTSNGQPLSYLRGHKAQLEDVAFAPDGKHIVTASDDHTVRTYTCDVCGSVYELARLAHERLVQVSALLTVRERKRYLGG
jgi:WD40 repeat protein